MALLELVFSMFVANCNKELTAFLFSYFFKHLLVALWRGSVVILGKRPFIGAGDFVAFLSFSMMSHTIMVDGISMCYLLKCQVSAVVIGSLLQCPQLIMTWSLGHDNE